MKRFWERFRAVKGSALLLALAILAAASLLLPLGQGGEGDAAMTQEEQRVSATLSRIAGAGPTRISIAYAAQSEGAFSSTERLPIGAVIVAAGAGDIAVRLDLIRAAQALLRLPAEAVEVFVWEDAP